MSIDALIGKANPDGGWPYLRGPSATEPTVYAVLALLGAGESAVSARGLEWLRRAQRADGGWSPQPNVDESNWTTALAALLPPDALGAPRHAAAIRWLMATSGRESSLQYRLRNWLIGAAPVEHAEFAGWPWIRGAAAWVGPTSIALLALSREAARRPASDVQGRIAAGQQFLLFRACRDGGWNHGSARALGYDGKAYPETTGMALAALRGVDAPEVRQALTLARQFLADCRSADAHNWLRLGLAAHGDRQTQPWSNPFPCRTVSELAVATMLAGNATAGLL